MTFKEIIDSEKQIDLNKDKRTQPHDDDDLPFFIFIGLLKTMFIKIIDFAKILLGINSFSGGIQSLEFWKMLRNMICIFMIGYLFRIRKQLNRK